MGKGRGVVPGGSIGPEVSRARKHRATQVEGGELGLYFQGSEEPLEGMGNIVD